MNKYAVTVYQVEKFGTEFPIFLRDDVVRFEEPTFENALLRAKEISKDYKGYFFRDLNRLVESGQINEQDKENFIKQSPYPAKVKLSEHITHLIDTE